MRDLSTYESNYCSYYGLRDKLMDSINKVKEGREYLKMNVKFDEEGMQFFTYDEYSITDYNEYDIDDKDEEIINFD
jgi:hypothetical protein